MTDRSPIGELLFESAVACFQKGQLATTRALLERLERRGEDEPRSFLLRALCAAAEGDTPRAETDLARFQTFIEATGELDWVDRDRLEEWLDLGQRWLESLERRNEGE